MPVCKVDKRNGFTIMSNGLLRDKRISMKSRGLLAYILSLPEDWDYTIAGLSSASGMGKKALASGLTELEQAGYLERHMLRAEDGTFLDVEYLFHEEPKAPLNASADAFPAESAPEGELIGRDQPQLMQKKSDLPSTAKHDKSKGSSQKSKESCGFYPFPHFRQTDNGETVLYKDNNKEQRTDKRNLSICRAEIKEQIGYETLAEQYGRDRVDGVIDLITEIYTASRQSMTIGRNQFQTALVQARFAKLSREHIEYVFDCIDAQKQRIHNMKAYLMAALFNAPAVMEEDFNNRVRVDYPLSPGMESNPP